MASDDRRKANSLEQIHNSVHGRRSFGLGSKRNVVLNSPSADWGKNGTGRRIFI